MKKIAVCGYTSAVGKYFLKKYEKEFEFVLLGRKNPDIFLDLTECQYNDDMEKLYGCDALINFAAVSDSDTDNAKNNMVKVNVNGPLLLAEMANKYKIPYIIHISSISATYKKNDTYYGYYSITKKTAESLLELYCEENQIGLCILEPTAMYGDQSFEKHQKLLYGIIKQIQNNKNVMLYGKKDAKRNYLNVDILCTVIRRLVEKNIRGKYIVANMKNMSLTEIVNELNRHYKKKSDICFCLEKPDVEECVINDKGEIYDLVGMEKPTGLTLGGLKINEGDNNGKKS